MDPKIFKEWWLARDSNDRYVCCYPTALTQMRKIKGCVQYDPETALSVDRWGITIFYSHCKRIFGHTPRPAQLLKVKWTKDAWVKEVVKLKVEES